MPAPIGRRLFPYLVSPTDGIPVTPHVPDPSSIMRAADLNNEALRLEHTGLYADAEKKYLAALDAKIRGAGVESSQAALTTNALGELYLKMGKLDEAQEMLEHAERVRSSIPADIFDVVCTRDNLGRLSEMRGDVAEALEWRTKGNSDQMICSYFECPKSANIQFSTREQLKKCVKCKCAFYCDRPCQKADWKRHKGFCCEPQAQ